MSNKKITICDTNVHPGEVANLALPLPEQYSCSPLYMPIKVIHGKKKGPCLVIFSVLKGTELNGLEIANRIIKTITPSQISGTIIAIPVMNVYGLTHYPSTLPTLHYRPQEHCEEVQLLRYLYQQRHIIPSPFQQP